MPDANRQVCPLSKCASMRRVKLREWRSCLPWDAQVGLACNLVEAQAVTGRPLAGLARLAPAHPRLLGAPAALVPVRPRLGHGLDVPGADDTLNGLLLQRLLALSEPCIRTALATPAQEGQGVAKVLHGQAAADLHGESLQRRPAVVGVDHLYAHVPRQGCCVVSEVALCASSALHCNGLAGSVALAADEVVEGRDAEVLQDQHPEAVQRLLPILRAAQVEQVLADALQAVLGANLAAEFGAGAELEGFAQLP
mmetsp:Transcript_100787/g.267922  ORF Transcript_100787/g.267922 Transcript_100787/m.267922 type:complete len:253 (-) Transcript_100787:507-1265(-)